MGKAAGLVVLPNQLIVAVIDIGGGIGTVRDRENVAVTVIGVGVGHIVTGRLQTVRGNLPTCPLFGWDFGDGRAVPLIVS